MDVPPADVANPNAVAGYDADAGPGCIEGRIRTGSEADCRGVTTGRAQDPQREHGSGHPTQTVRGWVTLVGKIDIVLAPIPMRAACGRYAIDGSDLVTIPNSGGIPPATSGSSRRIVRSCVALTSWSVCLTPPPHDAAAAETRGIRESQPPHQDRRS